MNKWPIKEDAGVGLDRENVGAISRNVAWECCRWEISQGVADDARGTVKSVGRCCYAVFDARLGLGIARFSRYQEDSHKKTDRQTFRKQAPPQTFEYHGTPAVETFGLGCGFSGTSIAVASRLMWPIRRSPWVRSISAACTRCAHWLFANSANERAAVPNLHPSTIHYIYQSRYYCR